MKTPLFISFLAAAALLAAATVRADLGHSWDSGSELPAAVDSALSSSDSSSEPASGDSSDTSATPSPSLDTQIADLLDDESLATSSSSSLDLSTFTVPLSEEEVLLDRLAVEVAAEVADDAEAPSTPDISAPVGASDTTFASGTDRIATRVSSVMAVQGSAAPADAVPSGAFTASDEAKNYGGEWNIGDNHGSGFAPWRQIASADLPSRSVNDTDGFAIYAQSGVGVEAVARSFADGIALESGTFKVSATHDSSEHFSGFALYSAGDVEILRWGITKDEKTEGGYATGFWYFRNGQSTLIQTIDVGWPVSADYSISWTLLSSGMSVALSIDSEIYADTLHLTLDSSSAVTAIAALVAGSDPEDTLHFDHLQVSGRAVPEPATLALLLLGTLALRPLRRK